MQRRSRAQLRILAAGARRRSWHSGPHADPGWISNLRDWRHVSVVFWSRGREPVRSGRPALRRPADGLEQPKQEFVAPHMVVVDDGTTEPGMDRPECDRVSTRAFARSHA